MGKIYINDKLFIIDDSEIMDILGCLPADTPTLDVVMELTVNSVAGLVTDAIKEALIPFDDIAKEEARTFAKDMFIRSFMKDETTLADSDDIYGMTFCDYLNALPAVYVDGHLFMLDDEHEYYKNAVIRDYLNVKSIKSIVEKEIENI